MSTPQQAEPETEPEDEPETETDIEADADAGGSYRAASSDSDEDQPNKLDRARFVQTRKITKNHRNSLAKAMLEREELDLHYR